MRRLSEATLRELPAGVARPDYERAGLGRGIVHLGVGAFHRAHQAAYTDAAIAAGDRRWGIVAASLRSADTRDALAPQDGLYALEVRGEADRHAVIGAITSVLVGPEDPAALIATMAAAETAIVSLTVTEKAYCHDPATGSLDASHPDIQHDLAHPEAPRTALGTLAAALRRRRAAGTAPFTVLCCDNLPANGAVVQRLLTQFAELGSADFGAYVAAEVACPSTMVDRIVPATTDDDRARVSAALGLEDAWPVVTEPFSQWVVEDRFPLGRPDWAGVELVRDVAPFEAMKLRMLNASHSALAYLGYLAGAETVADAMRQPGLAAFAERVMDEAAAVLPAGLDTAGYKRSLLERFKNPALRHRTWQIAMDGSQKLPQRILSTLSERRRRGLPIATQAMVVAAWMRFVTGVDEAGRPIEVRDPMAAELARVVANSGTDAARLAPALLGARAIFGELGDDTDLREAVVAALTLLYARGAARACVENPLPGRA